MPGDLRDGASDPIVNPIPVLACLKDPAWKPKRLTREQVEAFARDGFLVLPASELLPTADHLQRLVKAVDAMDDWPDAPGKYMKYYENKLQFDENGVETKTSTKILHRIENFFQYTPELNDLVNGSVMMEIIADLFGQPGILYKEKINYKLPGGEGFKPHQDVAAGWWMYGQTIHISALISVDEATAANGCLEVVRGEHHKLLGERWKEVPSELVEKMKWESLPTKPGDVVLFDSFVPHRSGPNMTDSKRRVLYTTYALASEGDLRERYYADKRKSFPPDCERDASQTYEYKI